MKVGIHPEYYPEAKVFFRGEQVMTVGATVPELTVEIWSGSHPFYTGKQKIVDTAGRVERFRRKYGMSSAVQNIASYNARETIINVRGACGWCG